MKIFSIGFVFIILSVVYVSILQYIYVSKKDMLSKLPNKVNSLNFIDDSKINNSLYNN